MKKVSCLMLTYNKPPQSTHLVEESIESFLRQDYPLKELVILNDTPGQPLALANPVPDVHVINLPRRVKSLGEKVNVCAAMSYGDLLMRWDDDDIHLPWRIKLSVERIGQADYWKPARGWWCDAGQMELMSGFMGACCFTREAFAKVGGYPMMGVGEDQHFEVRLKNAGCRVDIGQVTDEEAFYVYRWGTGSIHVSGYGPEGYERCGQNEIIKGEFKLRPHWRLDYVDEAKQSINRSTSPRTDRRVVRHRPGR